MSVGWHLLGFSWPDWLAASGVGTGRRPGRMAAAAGAGYGASTGGRRRRARRPIPPRIPTILRPIRPRIPRRVRPATRRPPTDGWHCRLARRVATTAGPAGSGSARLPGDRPLPGGPQPPAGDPGPLYTPYGSPDAMAAARPLEPGGASSAGWWTTSRGRGRLLPTGLMYKSYLAGGREPRFGTQFVHERTQGWLWDTTLGARVGLVRYGTENDLWPEGWQLDVEGAAFPRLMLEHDRDLNSVDFRAGMPLTYRVGPWEMKFGYYHYCSHLGDEFVLTHPEVTRINYVRETLIFGLAAYLARICGCTPRRAGRSRSRARRSPGSSSSAPTGVPPSRPAPAVPPSSPSTATSARRTTSAAT